MSRSNSSGHQNSNVPTRVPDAKVVRKIVALGQDPKDVLYGLV